MYATKEGSLATFRFVPNSVLLNAHFCLVYVSRLFFQGELQLAKNGISEEVEDNVYN